MEMFSGMMAVVHYVRLKRAGLALTMQVEVLINALKYAETDLTMAKKSVMMGIFRMMTVALLNARLRRGFIAGKKIKKTNLINVLKFVEMELIWVEINVMTTILKAMMVAIKTVKLNKLGFALEALLFQKICVGLNLSQ